MPKRVAIASLMQESNSFSPLLTTVETFESYYIFRGDEILTGYAGARTEVPGFLDALKDVGATPVPLLAAYAAAGGTVTRAKAMSWRQRNAGRRKVNSSDVVR